VRAPHLQGETAYRAPAQAHISRQQCHDRRRGAALLLAFIVAAMHRHWAGSSGGTRGEWSEPPRRSLGGEQRGASPRTEDEALAPAGLNLVDDLPAELLALVAGALPLDDELAAALSCRRLHAAVASARLRDGRASSTTSAVSVLATARRVEWAVSCGLPLGASLVALAARRGQLDALRCLRAYAFPCNGRAERASETFATCEHTT
jgi:hypothetical protein